MSAAYFDWSSVPPTPTRTGFTHERAIAHEAFLESLLTLLDEYGYQPQKLDANGDLPDVLITDELGLRAYVDVKTVYPHHKNYSIKTRALWTYLRCDHPVYIVWADGFVDTPESAMCRILGGPRRPTGRGSRTDWYKIARGGTPLGDFFQPITET